MNTIYSYPDAYLEKFCTEGREARAIAAVAAIAGTASMSPQWIERLVIVQCYILACLENQADADDLFTAKLKSYRAEFESLLLQASDAASAAKSGFGWSGLTVVGC